MRYQRSKLLLAVLALVACAARDEGATPPAPEFQGTATSAAGMVVTGSPYATEAGVRMLEAGGNAVDAAVAAAFALAVAEPTQSGLGGRSQMVIRMADGTVHGIDGTTQVPAGYDPAKAPEGEHGHGAVGIPGTVAALTRALEEHGTLTRARVMEPAVTWARRGIHLPAGEARRLAEVAPEIDPASEVARVLLGPGSTPPQAGDVLRQPDLAGVLEAVVSDGGDAFYRGDIARRMAEDMAANEGFVTLDDLAAYRAVDAVVGRGDFRGLELVGTYLPASGVTVAEILRILERVEPPSVDDGTWAAAVTESLLAGFTDREASQAMTPENAAAWLTSDSLADRRARMIANKLRTSAAAGSAFQAPSSGYGVGAADDGSESAFTTHIAVADTFGNAVALTQSLGPTLGARVITPGLGFLYASTLGGYLAGGGPGYRPWSSQAPLLVVDSAGHTVLVAGGAGARRIVSALVTTLDRALGHGADLAEALAAPRLHPTGDQVLVEQGWGVQGSLEALGYDVQVREASYFARLNVVERLPDGRFRGVGEPRWPESAAGGPRR